MWLRLQTHFDKQLNLCWFFFSDALEFTPIGKTRKRGSSSVHGCYCLTGTSNDSPVSHQNEFQLLLQKNQWVSLDFWQCDCLLRLLRSCIWINPWHLTDIGHGHVPQSLVFALLWHCSCLFLVFHCFCLNICHWAVGITLLWMICDYLCSRCSLNIRFDKAALVWTPEQDICCNNCNNSQWLQGIRLNDGVGLYLPYLTSV